MSGWLSFKCRAIDLPVRTAAWRRLLRAVLLAAAFTGAAAHAQSGADADADRIIISGASGNLGGLTVDALLAQGVPASRLILVSRTPAALQRYAVLGASVRFGDFTEPDSLPAAYAGGRRMLLVSIGGGNLPQPRPELHRRAIDAAIGAGVRHIVYTSWLAISAGDTAGISADHVATEALLMARAVNWTMLRNSVYMDGVPQQAAAMLAAGQAVVPPDEDPLAYVTRADCAAAAAAVLTTPGHENRSYDITGPEALGTGDIAAAAAAVGGREIELIAGTAATPAGFGTPALGRVSEDFTRLTGRPAMSLAELLAANRDDWLP
jgi:NAD(P)H dehydrogenase (quinone)